MLRLAAGLHKPFPPRRGQLWIPTSSRRAALAGLSLYPACRHSAVLVQRTAWELVKLFGPAALPGRSEQWSPMSASEWQPLVERWREVIGPFDEVAGYARTDASRGGLAVLLLLRGEPLAFVKLRHRDDGRLRLEARATELAFRAAPRAFRVPEPLDSALVGDWSFFAVGPLPPEIHAVPSSLDLVAVAAGIRAAFSLLQLANP